jgi:hypothetical protein
LSHDQARTVGRDLVPWAYAGTGAALKTAHKGFTHLGPDILNIDGRFRGDPLFDGSQK